MNGLFSSNANVVTSPSQLMANASRDLFTGLFNAGGMATPEQQVMGVMRNVDPTDLNSVKQGFQEILKISPEAAGEYRKQMMPFIESMQTQVSNEASLTKAKAQLTNAVNKVDPNSLEEQEKIYTNLMDEYNKTFCAGGGLFGGECKAPAMDDNMISMLKKAGFTRADGSVYLPSREQWVASISPKALEIYKNRTGRDVNTTPTDSVEPTKKEVSTGKTTENVVDDDRGTITITYNPETIKARFNLNDDELQEYGEDINTAISNGIKDETILDLIYQFRQEDQTRADGA